MSAMIRRPNAPVEKSPAGEQCPAHGWYAPDPEAFRLRDEARRRGISSRRGRELYAQAARIRNFCPMCGGPRPTPIEYARSIRLRASMPNGVA